LDLLRITRPDFSSRLAQSLLLMGIE